jgi:rSAM/selenodomain-associated transferase 1
MKNALIIFVRNPVLGKVKTRLAATIGNEKTLMLYKHLLQHTYAITENLPATKFVFYADYINEDDLWNGFEKRLQYGNDLGERMKNAFAELFTTGFKNICIIGSDCYELSSDILADAFEKLNTADVVGGPVTDGGYYILGMKKQVTDFFINKEWSTDTVFSETLRDAAALNLTLHQLPLLNDIDTEADLRNSALAFFV